MRTSRSHLTFVLCFLCLSCHFQQCNPFAFGLLSGGSNAAANAASNAAGQAMTMATAAGMNLLGSMLQSVASTTMLGFTTMQTMVMSLFSGFIMGVMALAGFIFFLLTLVPAEEYRGIGLASAAKLSIQNQIPQILNYAHNYNNHRLILNATSQEPSFLRNFNFSSENATFSSLPRSKRSTTLVKNNKIVFSNDTSKLTLESIAKVMNASDERIPRFLTSQITRFVQRDPLNCLPLIMCGLSAAARPNERTETLNDVAYVMKELLEDVADKDDKSEVEDDSSPEDDIFVEGMMDSMKNRERSPLDFLMKKHKKKDEVDKMIDAMHKEEDDKIEETVLTELADDPNDLKYALEEMKIRGLKKTMGKMTEDARRKYIQKLINEDSREESEGEDVEYGIPPQMSMMDYRGRHEYPPGPSYDEYGHGHHHYYEPERLVRGGYPPPPPLPPVPEYGSVPRESEEFYKRNLNVKKGKGKKGSSKNKKTSSNNKILIATPMPLRHRQPGGGRRRTKRDTIWSNRGARAYLQKKRGELMETDDLYDRARIAAEVGSVARNNRQCRAFFQGCPSMERKKPGTSASSSSSSRTKTIGSLSTSNKHTEADVDSTTEAPFLNRAVNNIRRVLLGPNSVSTKEKRVNEIKEVIQQIHPAPSHGGSEVKVVLNIGPSGPSGQPQITASGIPNMNGIISPVIQIPGQQYLQMPMYPSLTSQELGLPPPFSTQLIPQQTNRYVVSKKPPPTTTSRPKTTPKPIVTKPTKKVMKYMNPASSTSASKKPLPPLFSVPPTQLDKLANFLKTTAHPKNSDEDGGTTVIFDETETTISPAVVFSDGDDIGASEEEKPVEEVLVLPMSKEEYAENLRETFNIFNRFKEAHRNPPSPPTTAEAVVRNTIAPGKTTKRTPLQKNPSTGSTSGTGSGTQADTAQGDVQGQGQGQEEDIGQIWENIKDSIKDTWNNIRKNKKRKKKRKKKKKKPGHDDSSEESSEEEYAPYVPEKEPPLVAVPHPHDRVKIHWRSGTQLFTDKLYHLFFGKRVAKPLSDTKVDHGKVEYYSSSKESDDHSGELHVKEGKDHDEIHYSEPDTGPVIHHHKSKLRSTPVTYTEDEEQSEEKVNSTSSKMKKKKPSKGGSGSGPVLLIAKPGPSSTTPKSTKPKSKSKVKRKPSPTPEDDEDELEEIASQSEDKTKRPSSTSGKNVNRSQEIKENSEEEEVEEEDDHDQPHDAEQSEESNEYPEYISSRPKPKAPSASDSDEDDAEEVDDDDSEGEVYETGQKETTKPKLVYNPFSVESSSSSNSNSRGRIGLESSELPPSRKSSKRKNNNERKKPKPTPINTPPPARAKIKFSDLYGPKNSTNMGNGVARSSFSSRVIKTSGTSPSKPKRKVLRYKNG